MTALGFNNGGYINTHCFNGGWNPRASSKEGTTCFKASLALGASGLQT